MVIKPNYCLQAQAVIKMKYDDLYRDNEFFIFGDYPEDSNDTVNKKVIGKMKDEIKEAPNEKLLD